MHFPNVLFINVVFRKSVWSGMHKFVTPWYRMTRNDESFRLYLLYNYMYY